MNFLKAAGIVVVLALLAGVGFVYSSQVDTAADAPPSRPVYWLMENLRHRGIESRVSGTKVPDLEDPELIRSDAGNYNAMCTGCDDAFWIIKHGIKASGMPAWGNRQRRLSQATRGLIALVNLRGFKIVDFPT